MRQGQLVISDNPGGVGRCVRASAMAASSAVVGEVVKMVSVLRGVVAELSVTARAWAL